MKKLPLSLSLLFSFLLINLVTAQDCQDVFFSEYSEGSGNNKVLELYNPTSEEIDLSTFRIVRFSNGSIIGLDSLLLSGTIQPFSTFVVVNSVSEDVDLGGGIISPAVDPELVALADLRSEPYPDPLFFNGDDALGLLEGPDTLDIIGVIGQDPGGSWTDNAESNFESGNPGTFLTQDKVLRRKPNVSKGVTSNPGSFNAMLEWDVFPIDTWCGLGAHSCVCNPDFDSYTGGCLDQNACNYSPDALIDDCSCYYNCVGCQDEVACDYSAEAIVNSNVCDFSCYDCSPRSWGEESIPNNEEDCLEMNLEMNQGLIGEMISSAHQLRIWIDMEHDNSSGLSLNLIGPTGQIISLHSPVNGTSGIGYPISNFNPCRRFVFSADSSLNTLESASESLDFLDGGTYRATNAFTELLDSEINGTWTLQACQNNSMDQGSVCNWGLLFSSDLTNDCAEGELFGCTDVEACNYNAYALIEDLSCGFLNDACDDGNDQTITDVLDENCTCSGMMLGCTDSEAFNYDPLAVIDNGSCNYEPTTDFDGNGIVDGADLLVFNSEFGTVGIGAADFNQDGVVSAADLLIFLIGFGQ